MADRYLILSDLHLCDAEEHGDGWKFFKSSRYSVDRPLSALVDRFLGDAREGDRSVVVLNGDVFDFDLVTSTPKDPPWKISCVERRCGLFPSAEKSVWKLRLVLEHHRVFVDTLARIVASGGRVVYILGNHDREMVFEAMQQELRRAIAASLERDGSRWNGDGIDFEPWFFYVPGVLFAEHGNQYDPYAAYRDVLTPAHVVDGEPRLALPMGNLSNRYLLSRIGRFNPFSGDYIRTGASYFGHWLRYYALSKRSLVVNWLSGAVLVLVTLLRTRRRESRCADPIDGHLDGLAARTHIDVARLRELQRLHCSPVYERTFRVIRELWLDRVLLFLATAVATTVVALSPSPLWVKLSVPLVVFPVAYALYEALVRRGGTVFDVRELIPERAESIAALLDVPLVTFGHDHVPKMTTLDHGGAFADSGTWAPITIARDRTLAEGFRNYLVVEADDVGTRVAFESWPVIDAEEPAEVAVVLDVRQPAKSCA